MSDKRVLVITNEWPEYSGIVPANTLAGITEDFNYVKNLVEIAREISGYEVKEVLAYGMTQKDVDEFAPDYILAGGHCAWEGWGDIDYLKKTYAVECDLVKTTKVPYMGICAGHQFLSMAYGSIVAPMGDAYEKDQEYGPAEVKMLKDDPLFKGLPDPFRVMMYHSWEIKNPPDEFEVIGSTNLCRYAMVRHKERPVYGVQFHPEMLKCETVQDGEQLLRNFFAL